MLNESMHHTTMTHFNAILLLLLTCREGTGFIGNQKIVLPNKLQWSSKEKIVQRTNDYSNVYHPSFHTFLQSANQAVSGYSRIAEFEDGPKISCEHFGTCPGCVTDEDVRRIPVISSAKRYFNSPSLRLQRADKGEDDDFFKVVVPSSVRGWRTQAKLAVAKKSAWGRDGCIFGLYERGTHNVLTIPSCEVHHPQINRAIEILTKATMNVRTSAYDELTGSGLLRYVQCQVERVTGKVCLTLVMNAEKYKDTQPELSRLTSELKKLDSNLWHSIWLHCNNSNGNAIFARGAERWSRLDGPEFVREALCTTDFSSDRKDGLLYFTPATFRQGNLDGFDMIARDVAEAVPTNAAVCELYGGVGTLGLTALSYAHYNHPLFQGNEEENFKYDGLRWLRCSDENPANLNCFNRSANSMPSEVTGRPTYRPTKEKLKERKASGKRRKKIKSTQFQKIRNEGKVSYTVASATKALLEGQALGAECLIVDPPRKGLDDEVMSQLCKPFNPKQPFVESFEYLYESTWNTNFANDVKTLIYVSCGFDALARDCDKLLSGNAGWTLER